MVPGNKQHLRWKTEADLGLLEQTALKFGNLLFFVTEQSVLNLSGFLYLPLVRCVFKLNNIKYSNNGADGKSKTDLP